jgi:hypothetical protein
MSFIALSQEAPPKEEEVEVDGVDAVKVKGNITVLRGICSKRLKFDIEYSRKRGTTDNTYLVKVASYYSFLPSNSS